MRLLVNTVHFNWAPADHIGNMSRLFALRICVMVAKYYPVRTQLTTRRLDGKQELCWRKSQTLSQSLQLSKAVLKGIAMICPSPITRVLRFDIIAKRLNLHTATTMTLNSWTHMPQFNIATRLHALFDWTSANICDADQLYGETMQRIRIHSVWCSNVSMRNLHCIVHGCIGFHVTATRPCCIDVQSMKMLSLQQEFRLAQATVFGAASWAPNVLSFTWLSIVAFLLLAICHMHTLDGIGL